jgi:hypothetical protein
MGNEITARLDALKIAVCGVFSPKNRRGWFQTNRFWNRLTYPENNQGA